MAVKLLRAHPASRSLSPRYAFLAIMATRLQFPARSGGDGRDWWVVPCFLLVSRVTHYLLGVAVIVTRTDVLGWLLCKHYALVDFVLILAVTNLL